MIQRLGLVLECYREGPDDRVLRCLIRRISPDTEIHVRCMGSKGSFRTDAVKAAELLIAEDQCHEVFLVWDLQPEWADDRGKPFDCVEECKALLAQFPPWKVSQHIHLICITYMLEAWVVADERALATFFSTAAYKAKVQWVKSPETEKDTKALLIDLCVSHRGRARRYQDRIDAVRILQACPDTSRLTDIPSFARFAEKLTGNAKANFIRDGSACSDFAANYLNPSNAQAVFGTSK